ncbi:MAG: RsmD family RNA methyltransferase [Gemmatimonadaceae bacterium]|nr:RsmD family RNA methyltransferase [Gemmatimonadaceae bacterium]
MSAPASTATLQIDGIAAGGDGVARHEGMVVFVPRAVPGDEVLVALERHKRFARGQVLRVLVPSPERVEPACPHYLVDRCGGCQLQGLAYEAQCRAKGRIVADALTRLAGRAVGTVPVAPSPTPFRYRNALSLALRRDRLRPGGWLAGLHVQGRPDELFALVDCRITRDDVNAAWQAVLRAGEHLPRAFQLRGTIRALGDGAMGLHIEGGERWPEGAIRALAEAVPALAAIWWTAEDGRRALRFDRRQEALPLASFAQVNDAVAEALRAHVLAMVQDVAPGRVVDAYAGTGAYAVPLAARGIATVAIELDPDAASAMAAAFRAARAPRAAVRPGRVEVVLPEVLPADVVVLNPPRAGVAEGVMAALAAVPPQRLVYVSCDPATLARDLARLGPGWRLHDVRAFDMFPQTAHVETVCTLDREDG